jgi:hypothetical protein
MSMGSNAGTVDSPRIKVRGVMILSQEAFRFEVSPLSLCGTVDVSLLIKHISTSLKADFMDSMSAAEHIVLRSGKEQQGRMLNIKKRQV